MGTNYITSYQSCVMNLPWQWKSPLHSRTCNRHSYSTLSGSGLSIPYIEDVVLGAGGHIHTRQKCLGAAQVIGSNQDLDVVDWALSNAAPVLTLRKKSV